MTNPIFPNSAAKSPQEASEPQPPSRVEPPLKRQKVAKVVERSLKDLHLPPTPSRARRLSFPPETPRQLTAGAPSSARLSFLPAIPRQFTVGEPSSARLSFPPATPRQPAETPSPARLSFPPATPRQPAETPSPLLLGSFLARSFSKGGATREFRGATREFKGLSNEPTHSARRLSFSSPEVRSPFYGQSPRAPVSAEQHSSSALSQRGISRLLPPAMSSLGSPSTAARSAGRIHVRISDRQPQESSSSGPKPNSAFFQKKVEKDWGPNEYPKIIEGHKGISRPPKAPGRNGCQAEREEILRSKVFVDLQNLKQHFTSYFAEAKKAEGPVAPKANIQLRLPYGTRNIDALVNVSSNGDHSEVYKIHFEGDDANRFYIIKIPKDISTNPKRIQQELAASLYRYAKNTQGGMAPFTARHLTFDPYVNEMRSKTSLKEIHDYFKRSVQFGYIVTPFYEEDVFPEGLSEAEFQDRCNQLCEMYRRSLQEGIYNDIRYYNIKWDPVQGRIVLVDMMEEYLDEELPNGPPGYKLYIPEQSRSFGSEFESWLADRLKLPF